MNPELIGYMAAFVTTSSYIPQLVKIIRHKHTASISLLMYVMITSGLFLWLVYGFMVGSLALILANGLTFCMSLMVLLMKIRHG